MWVRERTYKKLFTCEFAYTHRVFMCVRELTSGKKRFRRWYCWRENYAKILTHFFGPALLRFFALDVYQGCQDLLPGFWKVFSLHFPRFFQFKREKLTRKTIRNHKKKYLWSIIFYCIFCSQTLFHQPIFCYFVLLFSIFFVILCYFFVICCYVLLCFVMFCYFLLIFIIFYYFLLCFYYFLFFFLLFFYLQSLDCRRHSTAELCTGAECFIRWMG